MLINIQRQRLALSCICGVYASRNNTIVVRGHNLHTFHTVAPYTIVQIMDSQSVDLVLVVGMHLCDISKSQHLVHSTKFSQHPLVLYSHIHHKCMSLPSLMQHHWIHKYIYFQHLHMLL